MAAIQPAGQVCPSTALQSFPNALSGAITQETYAAIATYQPLSITFQWADQRTPSTFRDSNNGVILLPQGITNTLRYNSNTYTLSKLQLTQSNHGTWIIPSSEVGNAIEDLVFTFTLSAETAVPSSPSQIIIVVPILEHSVVTADPPYFKMMVAPDNTAVSLGNFFPLPKPANTMHAYYSVCTRGVQDADPPQTVLVVVQVLGLAVSRGLMDQIRQLLNTANANPFGPYEPVDGTVFLNQNVGASLSNFTIDIATKGKLGYAYNLGVQAPTQIAPSPTDALKYEEVDAYKCVPFDPESQVVDGKIKIDTTTGEVFSQVDLERGILKTDAKGSPSATLLSAEDFVQKLTTAMSILVGVLLFGIITYILMFSGGGVGTAEETGGFWARLGVRIMSNLTPLLFAVVAGLIGFAVGLALR